MYTPHTNSWTESGWRIPSWWRWSAQRWSGWSFKIVRANKALRVMAKTKMPLVLIPPSPNKPYSKLAINQELHLIPPKKTSPATSSSLKPPRRPRGCLNGRLSWRCPTLSRKVRVPTIKVPMVRAPSTKPSKTSSSNNPWPLTRPMRG
ncbi:MPN413 family protein [Mycoplasmoides pneumoniae]